MTHRIGTREEWQAARDELAQLEAEQAERNEEVKKKRLALPWVRVEKEYELDTQDGKRTLAELFDGRSQLLAYNVMFGPDYTLGACPGCSSLADGLNGALVCSFSGQCVRLSAPCTSGDKCACLDIPSGSCTSVAGSFGCQGQDGGTGCWVCFVPQ